jgi:capsid protein
MPVPVIKATPSNQIKSAQGVANRATNVFKATMDNLEKSNDLLSTVIASEEEKIKDSKLNIQEATLTITSNTAVINKLKELIV